MRSGMRRWIDFLPLASVPLLLLTLWAAPVHAAHDIGQSCYICHNIQAGTTWQGSYSIYTGKSIGMSAPTGGKPINCDICHVEHGRMFDNTALGGEEKSAHPVKIIDGSTTTAVFGYGTSVYCLDCHKGNQVTSLSPDLNPDVAPSAWDTKGTDTGYPNHDVLLPDNQVLIGVDNGHLTLSTSSYNSYDNTPGTAGADSSSKYALCFQCHTAAGSISRASGRTIQADYAAGGHYFQGGAWEGKVMPCSDCHASHRSQDSSRLMDPNLSSGSWTGVVYSSASNPIGQDIRNMCNACHNDTASSGGGYVAGPTIRDREPSVRPSKVPEHVSGTVSCALCHTAHNPKIGTDCLYCHKTAGGGKAGSYDFVGNLFKGTGLPGGTRPDNNAPLIWSQHGNGLTAANDYKNSYNSKADNFCFKCHGDRHNGTAALVQADAGDTGGEVFFPVDSLRAVTTPVDNANNFCLSCHDGDGAAVDVQIGGVSPPVVSRANWTASGHGKLSPGNYGTSNNSAANLKCVACHEVHGSNHANLLPADNTVAGNHALPAGTPGKTIGATLASALDFRDYTDPLVAGAGFDNNWKWNRGFGTVGDPANQYGPNEGNKLGLCDACHRDDPSVNQTLNKAHTHMGIKDQGDPKSQMSFIRDCAECHDVHGGKKGTPNIYMISDNIAFRPGTAQAAVRDVTFRALSGADSFDDNVDATSNAGDLCTVCHESSGESAGLNVGHNYYSNWAAADHKENQNCLGCHTHGATDNASKVGFPQGGACNSCHGFTDTDGMPSFNDGGTYHPDANPSLSTRGSGDNTAHKIHVNYLMTRLGLNASNRVNACYVCHKGGGGNESHPENPTTTGFGQTSPTPDAQYVDILLDNAIVGFGAGRPQPTYVGTKGSAASQANGWKTCNNTTCHYAESPSWSGKRQMAAGNLAVDSPTSWPATGNVSSGSTNNVVDKIRLVADATGGVNVSALKVRLAAGSTAVNTTDILAVKFYADADNDNVIDPPASPLGGGAATFSGADNSYTRSGMAISLSANQTTYVLVSVDIASGATNGSKVILEAVDNTYVTSDAKLETFTSFTSNQFTIQSPGNLTVASVGTDPVAGNISAGTTNNPVDRMTWQTNAGGVTVSGFTISETNTATDSDITNVKVWEDGGTLGVYDIGVDNLVGTATWSGSAYVASGLNYPIPANTTRNLLITADVASAPTNNNILVTRVDNVTASSGTVNSFTPFSSNQFTIQAPAWVKDGDFEDATNFNSNWSPAQVSGNGTTVPVKEPSINNTGSAGTSASMSAGRYEVNVGEISQSLAQKISGPASNVTMNLAYYASNNKTWGAAGWKVTGNLVVNGNTNIPVINVSGTANSTWATSSDNVYSLSAGDNITGVRIRYYVDAGSSSGTTAKVFVDDITISYGGRPAFAPPRTTGDTATAACDTCHQFGPRDYPLSNTTYGNPTTGFDADQYFYSSPGSHIKHGVGDPGAASWTPPAPTGADGTSCTPCHGDVSGYDTSTHIDGTKYVRTDVGTTATFADNGVYAGGSKTCTSVYCHGGRQTPQSSGTSWGSGSTVCGSCHAAAPPYGKHDRHSNGWQGGGSTSPTNNSGASGYDYSCYYCHYGNAHVDYPFNRAQRQDADVTFNGPLGGRTLSTGASYTAGGATNAGWDNVTNEGISFSDGACAVYCHSNADPSALGGGAMTYASPKWVTGSVTCTACHKGPDTFGNMSTVAPQMSRGHWEHAATDRYRFTCDECHANTVAIDCTTTLNASTGYTYHVNGNKNVDGQDIKGGTGIRSTGINDNSLSYNSTNRTCSATYCHSDGTDNTASFTGSVTTPAWDNATGTTCASCHKSDNASGNPMTTGAHGKHLNNSIRCSSCHFYTADNTGNTALRAATGYTYHVNGVRDVVFDNAFDSTPGSKTDDWNGTSCSNVKCHGSQTISWSATITSCSTCHAGTGDVNDFTWGNFTGTLSRIDNTQWLDTGHGRTSGQYPWPADNTGANLSCMSGSSTTPTGGCHTFSVGHNDTATPNFYRLAWSGALDNGTGSTGINAFCGTCHLTSVAQTHSEAVTGGNNWGSGTPAGKRAFTCIDCHEPHGDGVDYMVQAQVWGSSSSTSLIPDNATGLGFEPNTGSMVFNLSATPAGSDYVTNGAATNKMCQVCHQGNAYWTRTSGALTTHPNASPGRCTSCHEHKDGFKASCNSCHGVSADPSGMPPTAPTTARGGNPALNWGSLVDPATGAADNVGDHRAVSGTTPAVSYSSHGAFTCDQCHTSTPGAGGTHNDGLTSATMTQIAALQGWTYNSGNPAAVWDNGGTAGNVRVTDDTCSNVVCHSPAYSSNSNQSGTPFPYKRYWLNSTKWDCYTCHAYDGRTATTRPGGTDNTMGTGSHAKHVGNVPAAQQMGCTDCHVNNGTNTWHKNGTVGFGWVTTPDPYGYAESYSQASQAPTDNVSPRRAWGSCGNVYCHSIAQTSAGATLTSGNTSQYKSVTWGAAIVCGNCHDDDPNRAGGTGTPMQSGSHRIHVDNTSWSANAIYNFTCTTCHTNAGYDNVAAHANGWIEIAISGTLGTITLNGTFDNASPIGTDDGKTVPGGGFNSGCTNVYCHSDGKAAKSGTTVAPTYNAVAWNTTKDCEGCHGVATADTSGTYYFGVPDYANGGTGRQDSNSHDKHVTNSIPCSGCHYATITDTNAADGWALRTGVARHVNGSIDVELDNTYDSTPGSKTDDWNSSTKACSNVKCHGPGSIQWGATIASCSTCHLSSSADVNDFAWGNYGGTKSNIDNAQWLDTGHGKASGQYPWPADNTAANLSCMSSSNTTPTGGCHTFSVGHNDNTTPNFYRLAWSGALDNGTGSTGINAFCGTCHPTSVAKTHSEAETQFHGTNNWGSGTPAGKRAFTCIDCHEPHGDGVDYMVQAQVWGSSSSTSLIPDNATGLGFEPNTGSMVFNLSATPAGSDYVTNGAATNKMCQVCHQGNAYWTRTSGALTTHPNQNPGRCTDCHPHSSGFRGSGHSTNANCKGCHAAAQGGRPAIQPEFEKKAAHIDNVWANIQSPDCEKCHDEQAINGIITLKVWSNGSVTGTINYDNTFANRYTVNDHCLGCHQSNMTSTDIWSASGTQSPKDIATKWSSSVTGYYSKYDPNTYNVVPQLTKALSPHRYPGANKSKYNGSGTDTNMTTYEYTTRTVNDTNPVSCLDCHPSHGSNLVSGHDNGSGRNTATGATGGIMILSDRPAGTAKTYLNEAQMCWDCHVEGMDYKGDAGGAGTNGDEWQGNWSNTPFAVKKGAFRSSHFYPSKRGAWTLSGTAETATGGSTTRTGTPPANARTNISCSTCHDPHGASNANSVPALRGTWLTSPYKEDRPPTNYVKGDVYYEWRTNANITVSAGQGARGARLTPEFTFNMPANLGLGYAGGDTTTTYGKAGSGVSPSDTGGFYIDENTFGTSGGWIPTGASANQKMGTWWDGDTSTAYPVTPKHFTLDTNYDTPTEFAGLCLACHTNTSGGWTAKAAHKTVPGLTGTPAWIDLFSRPYMHVMHKYKSNTEPDKADCTVGKPGSSAGWHDGECGYKWAYPPDNPGTAQTNYHQFPCSKCHTPHAARLPRLMMTNCLDVGNSATAAKHAAYTYPQDYAGGAFGIPSSTPAWAYNITCHAKHDNTASGGWNTVTPW